MPTLWVPYELPSLNKMMEYAKCRTGGRNVVYNKHKRAHEQMIGLLARSRGFDVPPGAWDYTYLFVEADARRDPSNISSVAVKLIEDALQAAKALENDGWDQVASIHQYFAIAKEIGVSRAGVLLHVGAGDPGKQAMTEKAQEHDRYHQRQARSEAHQARPHSR